MNSTNNNYDIEEIKQNYNYHSEKNEEKDEYSDNNLIYKYPKKYYNEENLLKIYWFFNFYMKKKGFSDENIKEIISEIFYFNQAIYNKLNNNFNKCCKSIWNNSKILIKYGYKLLDGIVEIKENNIIFNNGLNLFNNQNEEEKIDTAKNVFKKMNLFFNNNEEWESPEIKKIFSIIEKKKRRI